jgi:hypothetical protein
METNMQRIIRARLQEFYSELFEELYKKYPDNSKAEIQLAVDSVIEESLEWGGSAY